MPTRNNSTRAWEFKARFRRHAFGWKPQLAIRRVKGAVSEIKKTARRNPLLGAEGAVIFLERLSPALENVDRSSGAMVTAVNNAIAELAPFIAGAPATEKTRAQWLERLWEACQNDAIPYLESLGDHWGQLCASKEVASEWANRLAETVRLAWSPDPSRRSHFKGTTHCLSALVAAGRYDDVLALLNLAPHPLWCYRQFGVKALAAKGDQAEAIRYAEVGYDPNDHPVAIARACEEVLLSAGLVDEAYTRYGLVANRGATPLATFRAVTKKYPHPSPTDILADLVKTTPEDEGQWFTVARDVGLYNEALALARRAPYNPRTLARAARDYADQAPTFAVCAGLLAIHWLVQGYRHDITATDVWAAYDSTMKAADPYGSATEVKERIRKMVAAETADERFVTGILGPELGL